MKKYCIIGAGISGLTLAYELAKKGEVVRIFEKSKNIGGLARTEIINGVHFDCGPHLFHSNKEEIKNYWIDLLGDAISTPNLFGANFIDSKIYEYPLSRESISNQFSRAEIDIIEAELKERDLTRLSSAKNYEEYVEILAGPFLANRFFKRYPEKLWGIKTSELSARFAPRRVEIREESRAFHSGDGKWAAVLSGGCGVLASALEKRLNQLGVVVEYGMEVSNLFLKEGNSGRIISKIEFNNDMESLDVEDSIVVSTIPITTLADFFSIPNRLWYRSLKIVSALVGKQVSLPGGYDWLYFDSENLLFHRITLQDSFSRKGIPEGHSIISCEIAYSNGDAISCLEKSQILEKCVSDIIKVLPIKKDEIVSTHYMDAGYVYPGIALGYEPDLANVASYLDGIDNLYRHGALAEFEYSDLQVLTAKSIDLANVLSDENLKINGLVKTRNLIPASSVLINGREICKGMPPFIIAEAGLNHNGDLSIAKKLVLEAKKSGADAVKFQTYARARISKSVRTSSYYEDLVDTQESLSDLLDRIRLSKEDLGRLFQYANSVGITIFSTPFDIESYQILEEVGAPAYKISSMDIVNIPLIAKVAASMKPLIISTGMSTLANIEEALNAALSTGNDQIILLHCVSTYPCPPGIANLGKIKKLSNIFSVISGYSDHTTGIDIALASVAMGASVVEKHFTLDRKMDGPDHNFSLLPEELTQLTVAAKRIHSATQEWGFDVNNSEINTALNLRRSLFFARNMKEGEKVSEEDLVVKSPGIGLHPRYLRLVVGSILVQSVAEDNPVLFDHLISK